MRTVFGVGINDGKYPAKVNGVDVYEYVKWSSMLRRCYSEVSLNNNPHYKGCEVSENFKSYSYFYEWIGKQKGFKNSGFDLDKDLLGCGSIYDEDSCILIPCEINRFIGGFSKNKGKVKGWSIARNGKYKAQLRKNGINTHLGFFDKKEDAANAYAVARDQYIIELAEKYKGDIDSRAFEKIIKMRTEICDS